MSRIWLPLAHLFDALAVFCEKRAFGLNKSKRDSFFTKGRYFGYGTGRIVSSKTIGEHLIEECEMATEKAKEEQENGQDSDSKEGY